MYKKELIASDEVTNGPVGDLHALPLSTRANDSRNKGASPRRIKTSQKTKLRRRQKPMTRKPLENAENDGRGRGFKISAGYDGREAVWASSWKWSYARV